jgi:predicted RNA-binding protein
MKYWINTVSRDHVMIGQKNGIVQANHGKLSPLKRLKTGDKIIFYSPKTSLENGEPLKAFTAVSQIMEEKIYQVELTSNFKPFRINAQYEECNEVNIKPMIESLNFIQNKKSWGYMFRFGLFEIDEHDFTLIYSRMKK